MDNRQDMEQFPDEENGFGDGYGDGFFGGFDTDEDFGDGEQIW
jgi:hypothetical protein